jgi:hypothetical protein
MLSDFSLQYIAFFLVISVPVVVAAEILVGRATELSFSLFGILQCYFRLVTTIRTISRVEKAKKFFPETL